MYMPLIDGREPLHTSLFDKFIKKSEGNVQKRGILKRRGVQKRLKYRKKCCRRKQWWDIRLQLWHIVAVPSF